MIFTDMAPFTAVPNALFDRVQSQLSLSAWAVLCVILRRTRGWGKASDAISYEQIRDATGIKSDTTIAKALAELLSARIFTEPLLCREPGGTSSLKQCARYSLNPRFQVEIPPPISPSLPSPENEEQTASTSPENGVEAPLRSPENGDTKEREKNYHSRAPGACGHFAFSTSSLPKSKPASQIKPSPQSPLFEAVCAATQRDPTLVSPAMLAQLAACAAKLERAGYDAPQIELAASRWTLPTAPYPSQLLDNIQALLAARPATPRPPKTDCHAPHTKHASSTGDSPRARFENAAQRKARKWQQWLGELA